MKLIKVAAAVLNQTPLDWRHNPTNIRRVITAAREQGIGVLCLPELCLTGYGCEDAFHVQLPFKLSAVEESFMTTLCIFATPYFWTISWKRNAVTAAID